MKNIAYIICIATLIMAGCKPDKKTDIGEPFDKVAGLEGTWVLNSFLQKDLNNPVQEERDLSQYYIVEGIAPMELTFNAADRAYDIELTEGKNFFGSGGTWSFDNDQYPTSILFDDGTEENSFGLGSVVREFDNELTIQLEKGCSEDDLNVIYKFIFDRAQ